MVVVIANDTKGTGTQSNQRHCLALRKRTLLAVNSARIEFSQKSLAL
jgi:hypothetical protein